ncbi:hypothetical protein ORI99_01840 [Alishewanella sp. SMS9]|nr:hypothetical protein [Alishewanella sp. SMS9]
MRKFINWLKKYRPVILVLGVAVGTPAAVIGIDVMDGVIAVSDAVEQAQNEKVEPVNDGN